MTSHFRNSLIAAAVAELADAVALSGFTLTEVLLDRNEMSIPDDALHYTRTLYTRYGAVRVRVPA